MPSPVSKLLKVQYGTSEEYKSYLSNNNNVPRSGVVYYLSDTRQIMLQGLNFSRDFDTLIYGGHVDSKDKVLVKEGYSPDAKFIYSVGDSYSLYLIYTGIDTPVELNKIAEGSIDYRKVNFIVSEITGSGNDQQVASTKALVDYIRNYVENYLNSQKNIANGVAGLDDQVHISNDVIDMDTSPSSDSSKPVTSSGIKEALDRKVDKEDKRDLSTNDFDNIYKTAIDALITSSGESEGNKVYWGGKSGDGTNIEGRPVVYDVDDPIKDENVGDNGLLDAKTALGRIKAVEESSAPVTDSSQIDGTTKRAIASGIVYNTISDLKDSVKLSINLPDVQGTSLLTRPSETVIVADASVLFDSTINFSKETSISYDENDTNEDRKKITKQISDLGGLSRFVYFNVTVGLSSEAVSEDSTEFILSVLPNHKSYFSLKYNDEITAQISVELNITSDSTVSCNITCTSSSNTMTLSMRNVDGTEDETSQVPVLTTHEIASLKVVSVQGVFPLSSQILSQISEV